MGNYWKGTSDESLFIAEIALMKRAGVSEADYKIHNTPVDEQDAERYIHCIEVHTSDISEDGRQAMPKMVLLHGYGAGGCYFFRVIKDLAQHFHLYVVDLMGMGASGRPIYECQTPNEAEDFFVQSLKKWQLQMEGLKTKFYLAGHSLGGYVSAVYAMQYPEDLIKLILLSPVGLPERPDTFSHDEVAARFDSKRDQIGARLILHFWEKGYTPFGPLRATGSLGAKAFLRFYMGRRMKSITHDEELVEMKAYMHQIFMRPASGEYALNTILMPGSWAKNPLIHRLPSLQVPVAFYYGEKDWMDPYPAMQLIEENLLPSGAKLHVIDGSDHHLYLDNPADMVYKILLEVFGQQVSQAYRDSKRAQVDVQEDKHDQEEEKEGA